ncbi:hypothetical protein HF526_13520 [Pseudonocardia sp. K10HN5]|uniref:MFS transporter n=2 Tax=Pseudonocardia acidicola TaxID=2724939 RepID=A0ABX1SDQ2_9PSEU|nr:hypothetical protein [Pseudonocardia acidicola]
MMTIPTIPAHPILRRALVVAAAPVAALAVWALAGPVAGVDLDVVAGGAIRSVGAAAVAGSALLAGLAGWALLALLERTVDRPRRIWTVVAVGLLVVSLLSPLSAALTLAAGIALAAMHLATGAVLIPLLAGPGG